VQNAFLQTRTDVIIYNKILQNSKQTNQKLTMTINKATDNA